MCLGLAQKRGVPVAFVIPLFDQFQVPAVFGDLHRAYPHEQQPVQGHDPERPLVQGALPQKRVVQQGDAPPDLEHA